MGRRRLSSLFFGLLLVCQATIGASGPPSQAAATSASSWFSFQYFAAIVRDAVGG